MCFSNTLLNAISSTIFFSNASLIDEKGNTEKESLWESIGFNINNINNYNDANEQIQFMLNRGSFVYGMTMVFRAKYKLIILQIF